MRIAICDDDSRELDRLSSLLTTYANEHPTLTLHIRPFSRCEQLWAAAESGQTFDLYMLDVVMKDGMGGIALAERLSQLPRRPIVVFFTNSPEFAVDAFRVRAQHYLLKPLNQAQLFTALDEVIFPLLGGRNRPVTLSTVQNSRITVPMSSIVYTECDVHTIRYYMSDGTAMDSRSIRVPFATAIADLLDSGCFIQPHRSFAVNMEHIVRLAGQELLMRGGARIPVSRLRLTNCRTAYENFLLNGTVVP